MASFEERGSSIRAIVRIPGTRTKKTKTFDTRAEAVSWAERMENRKVSDPNLTGGKKVTELLEVYLDAVASKQDSGRWNTLRLLKWAASPIGLERIDSITPHRMTEWMNKRGEEVVKRNGVERQVAGSTVNREMNLWSAAFTYAVDSLKWLKVNPCHGATRPPEGPSRNRDLLTKQEIQALCLSGGYRVDQPLSNQSDRVVACFLFALETGMRSGEILRLRPRDYDKVNRVAKVTALEVGGRKGSKSGRVAASREVPLTTRATQLLDQLIKAMPSGQEPAPGFTRPPYIVGINDKNRDAMWRKIRDRAGVEDLTFHDTKHEACTRLSKLVDVLVLSHAIGTKDIRLLRDTYYVNDAAEVARSLPAQLSTNA